MFFVHPVLGQKHVRAVGNHLLAVFSLDFKLLRVMKMGQCNWFINL